MRFITGFGLCLVLNVAAVLWGCGRLAVPLELINSNSSPNWFGSSKNFTILTYNVAGLPDILSNTTPSKTHFEIGRRINQYDIALIQEDFSYPERLRQHATHRYQTSPMRGYVNFQGDGLSLFSKAPVKSFVRVGWSDCLGIIGYFNDCLAEKGFTFAQIRLSEKSSIHVYNLHADAGNTRRDQRTRARQFKELSNYILNHSNERTVIVAGDTNLNPLEATDLSTYRRFLGVTGLVDSCPVETCDPAVIDRIFWRNLGPLDLEFVAGFHAPDFVDANGDPLSDHPPIAVKFRWRDQSSRN